MVKQYEWEGGREIEINCICKPFNISVEFLFGNTAEILIDFHR